MFDKKIVLHFPKNLVDKPIIYKLVKDFHIEFNILKAEVNPNEEGLLVLGLKGEEKDFKQALDYLNNVGVKVQPLSQDIFMDENKCVDCGVCVPLCPTKALIMNKEDFKVEFLKDKCIACGICINICPYQAMKLEFQNEDTR